MVTHHRNASPRNPEHGISETSHDTNWDLHTKTPDKSDSATPSQLDCKDLFPAVNWKTILSWNKNENIAAASWNACNGNFSYNGTNGALTATRSFPKIWESALRDVSCVSISVRVPFSVDSVKE